MAIFLPGLGHTIITILLAIYSAYWLCYDAMSYSMDRNLWTLKKRFSFLIKYPIQNLFFGFAMYLFALIPVVNLFFMPLFVVSGTILFQKEKTSLENPWRFTFLCYHWFTFGSVAQSVEQRTENPRVSGSIPLGATKDFSSWEVFFFTLSLWLNYYSYF